MLLGIAAAIVLRVIRSGVGLQLMAMAADERLGESLGHQPAPAPPGGVRPRVGPRRRRRRGLVSVQGIVTPDVLSETAEITLLLMVFVAGRKSIAGAILGAVVIEYLTTSTSFISTNIGIIEGIALLVILIVEPDGVAGAVDRLLGRRTDQWGASLRSWSAARLRPGSRVTRRWGRCRKRRLRQRGRRFRDGAGYARRLSRAVLACYDVTKSYGGVARGRLGVP